MKNEEQKLGTLILFPTVNDASLILHNQKNMESEACKTLSNIVNGLFAIVNRYFISAEERAEQQKYLTTINSLFDKK